MSNKKSILILGGGSDQVVMIRTAAEMGIKSIVLDQNPHCPGSELADYFEPISTRNVGAICEFVDSYQEENEKIDGVSTMGSDIPHIVAQVAKHMNVPSIPLKSALLATNKYEMKRRFKEFGVKTPSFSLVRNPSDAKKIMHKFGPPIVIKPLSEAGSRGVFLLTSEKCIDLNFYESLRYSNNGALLVEKFVDGPQISTESIIIDGEIYTPGYADRNYENLEEFLPQIMENGGWVPSIYENIKDLVEEEILKASISIGLKTGVVKGDVVLGENGPVVIEIAARLSGGDFSESLVPISSGINYVKNVLELSLGKKPDPFRFRPEVKKVVANRYFFVKGGVLKKIEGLEKLSGKTWLEKFEIWRGIGSKLPKLSSHGNRTGVFVISGDSREIVQSRIDWVYDNVKFMTE